MESSSFLNTDRARGFTLAEMIIVIAIIGFVTVVALSGQANFDRSLIVTDTAYTVALSIRQAQTYGLSSRTFSGTSNAGYGAHFDAATPATYALFADVAKVNPATPPSWCPTGTTGTPDAKPGNCRYDASGSELVQNFSFGRGFTITQFCGHDTSNATHCSTDESSPLTMLDIVFIRPNTNSVVTGVTGGGSLELKDASIKISAPAGGGTRYVCVSKVGQVSVATTTCP